MEQPRRTIVKVCGITRPEDARAAVAAGADWLGFILWDGSQRNIAPERMRALTEPFESTVAVAVMVSPTPDQALRAAALGGADRVQLHRVDPAAWPADFPLPITFGPGEPDSSIGRRSPRPATGVRSTLRTRSSRAAPASVSRGDARTWRRRVGRSGGPTPSAAEATSACSRSWTRRRASVPGLARKAAGFVAAVRAWDERHRGRSRTPRPGARAVSAIGTVPDDTGHFGSYGTFCPRR